MLSKKAVMTKRNDISTPEGYFQNLQERLEAIPSRPQRVTLAQRVSPWLAYAASLAILAVLGNFIFSRAVLQPVDDAWDYYAYLSQSLDPDGLIELQEEPTLSDDEIVSYLLAENVSVLEAMDYEEGY